MNVLEQITPETLAALSSEEKRELLALLEAQQMPRLARHIERMHAWRAQGGKLDPNFSYSQALEEARKRREELQRNDPEEYARQEARHEQDFADLDAWRAKKSRERLIAEGKDPDAQIGETLPAG